MSHLVVIVWAVDPQQLSLNTGPKASIMILWKGKRLSRGALRNSEEPVSCWAIWKGNKRLRLGALALCLFIIWFSLATFCPLFTPSSPEQTPTSSAVPFLQVPFYNVVWRSLHVYCTLTDLRWDASLLRPHLHLFLSKLALFAWVLSGKWHAAQICAICLCQSLWPRDVVLTLFRVLWQVDAQ